MLRHEMPFDIAKCRKFVHISNANERKEQRKKKNKFFVDLSKDVDLSKKKRERKTNGEVIIQRSSLNCSNFPLVSSKAADYSITIGFPVEADKSLWPSEISRGQTIIDRRTSRSY